MPRIIRTLKYGSGFPPTVHGGTSPTCRLIPPEYNAAEPLWHHTRITGTHNRYFSTPEYLDSTLTRVFRSMQRNPEQIRGYLQPFV